MSAWNTARQQCIKIYCVLIYIEHDMGINMSNTKNTKTRDDSDIYILSVKTRQPIVQNKLWAFSGCSLLTIFAAMQNILTYNIAKLTLFLISNTCT